MRRIKPEISVERQPGRFEVLCPVVCVGHHQLRPRRPHRIGMLPVDLAEERGRLDIFPFFYQVHAAVVELLDRAFDIGLVRILAEQVERTAAADEERCTHRCGRHGSRTGPNQGPEFSGNHASGSHDGRTARFETLFSPPN